MDKHTVTVENREIITVTDVKSVDAFDEEEVCADLSEGGIIIKGKRLHIHKLDLEEGIAVIMGEMTSMTYVKKKADKSLKRKLFK